jgi:hypothetical protein
MGSRTHSRPVDIVHPLQKPQRSLEHHIDEEDLDDGKGNHDINETQGNQGHDHLGLRAHKRSLTATPSCSTVNLRSLLVVIASAPRNGAMGVHAKIPYNSNQGLRGVPPIPPYPPCLFGNFSAGEFAGDFSVTSWLSWRLKKRFQVRDELNKLTTPVL